MFANARSPQAQVMAPVNVCKINAKADTAPLPNTAQFSQAQTGSTKFSIQSQPVCTVTDLIPLSQGDASAMPWGGGSVSNRAMGASQCTTGSSKVFLEGKAVTRQTDPSTSNEKNASGNTLKPAQQIVKIAS